MRAWGLLVLLWVAVGWYAWRRGWRVYLHNWHDA